MMTATYSPDDNKLRLYSGSRLDPETFARVKAAGFKWAPKQDLFVAPMWTPAREDLLVELCGDIEDEDTSLVERAEERAERFEEYSDKRAADGDAAREAVKAIADNIPFGQPILVGHHSERRARKDAERIQSGMRMAVRMWKTSQYWTQRAAGAIRHAKHKEKPAVRHRRIKGIEADRRKSERSTKQAQLFLKLWQNLTDDSKWKLIDGQRPSIRDRALFIADRDHVSQCFPLDTYPRQLPASQYEGPMSIWSALDGGVISPEQARDIAVAAHERLIAANARWIEHYDNRLSYERAMLADAGGIITDKVPPEVGGAIRCIFSPGYGKGWAYIQKVNRVSVTIRQKPSHSDRTYPTTIPFDDIAAIMPAAEVEQARTDGRLMEADAGAGFYLVGTPPSEDAAPAKPVAANNAKAEDNAADFDSMRAALKQGIQIVAVPQLFPTPKALADRVADLADIQPGHDVLEPSAGTGALLGALGCRMFGHNPERGSVTAVEVVAQLAEQLRQDFPLTKVLTADFTACDDLGPFDRIVMNPPFAKGADIRHIEHAAGMLRPGGRLVAICANGPRQNERLRPQAIIWEDLPPGSFRDSGTEVNAAILVIQR